MHDLSPGNREALVNELRRSLSTSTVAESQADSTITITGGDPEEVVIQIDNENVSVAVFAVRWEDPYTPVVHPKQLATLNWKRLPSSVVLSALELLIQSARDIRNAAYRRCEYCGKTTPPEYMHTSSICQSCGEEYLGIVH